MKLQQISKYFYLESYVHVKINKHTVFLFNTLNKEFVEIKDDDIINIIKTIINPANPYVGVFECTNILSNTKFNSFIKEIINKKLGGLIEKGNKENIPFQILPNVFINNNIAEYDDNNANVFLKDIEQYIHHINITINNGKFSNESKYYENAYKQFYGPIGGLDTYKELSYNKIKKLISRLKKLPNDIIINGGNILEHRDIGKLILYFNKIDTLIVYQIDINDFFQNIEIINKINVNNSVLRIYVTPEQYSINKINDIKGIGNLSLHFIISNNDDYNKFNAIIEDLDIKRYYFHPYYLKENIDFFRNNIFNNTEDITNQNEDIITIESKGKFNPQLFGYIYIDYDEHIRLHPTSSSIGKINSDLFMQIFNEFVSNKKNIWFLTRNDVKPCSDCKFSLLCPAIASYELFADKYNMCTIN